MTQTAACTALSLPSIKFRSSINLSFMSAPSGDGCVSDFHRSRERAGTLVNQESPHD